MLEPLFDVVVHPDPTAKSCPGGRSWFLVDYGIIEQEFLDVALKHGVQASWRRQANSGKRHAQAMTFRDDDADIYVTLDSDTVLDNHAIEEGLKPFARRGVTWVAGLYLGLNAQRNLVTRIAELVCVSWQLQGRSASSRMGNVLVNSGAFALYRGWVFKSISMIIERDFLWASSPIQR